MSKIITLSEASAIALHSMVVIARSDEKLNVGQIADIIGSSRHHVAKVMQRLAKENYVASNRGPSGGFVLKKDPEEITLLNLYECIEGKIEVHSCPNDKAMCPFGECILGDVANKMNKEFSAFLTAQKLSMYIKEY